jgi:3-O-methyltransferase
LTDAEPDSAERSDVQHLSDAERRARLDIHRLLRTSPIPADQLPKNLPLYLRREVLADLLLADTLYRRILDVPGVVMEFGSRWGRRLAMFATLRELYEPYNFTRRVIGFDTFAGFPEVSAEDGSHPALRQGAFAVTDDYPAHLEAVLEVHERESFLSHLRRYSIEVGDVQTTLPRYLREHAETLISLAYFDLDLYRPTKACLREIAPRLVPGSVIAFDELAQSAFPGETRAVLEELDLSRVRLEQVPFHPYPVFAVVPAVSGAGDGIR